MQDSNLEVALDTYSPADWLSTHKPTELSRIKLKTWTQYVITIGRNHLSNIVLAKRVIVWYSEVEWDSEFVNHRVSHKYFS